MASFGPFSWDEPVFAGDKIPRSEDDQPCGEGWIPKEKECHDGEAHRPEPGENPYWTDENSAEKRREKGIPWHQTKPKKGEKEDKAPEEEEPKTEKEKDPEEQQDPDPLRDYASEYEKAVDPARQTKTLKPEEISAQYQNLKNASALMNIIGFSIQMAAKATKRYEHSLEMDSLQEELGRWNKMQITDSESLDEYTGKLNDLWHKIKESPIGRHFIEGTKTTFNNMNFEGQNFPFLAAKIEHSFDRYKAAKREDDPRDILKWNTLANKPDMMSFDDIPDLAWRDFPEGPKNDKELQFIEQKMQRFRRTFDTWAQTGGQTNGPFLAEILMGKPTEMGHMINQSPFLPNPKAAQIILEKSARAGDEEANDMMWYEFRRNEQWTENSYLHDYTKATQKAMVESKNLGLDFDSLKDSIRPLRESERAYNKWEKSVYKPRKEEILKEFSKFDEERRQRSGELSEESKTKEKFLIEEMDNLLADKVKRVKGKATVKKQVYEQIEKDRNSLLDGLLQANKNTSVDMNTFGKIINSFANIDWDDINPRDPDYAGEKGKQLMQIRQQARTRGDLELTHLDAIEHSISHLTSILHKDLLSSKRDPANAELTEIKWKYDVVLRAYAQKEQNVIAIDQHATPDTVVHEFGHHLEFRNQRVHQRILDFYDNRTRGKKLKTIRGYQKHERFKSGKFFIDYAGKSYGERMPQPDNPNNPATELISTGLQALYNPEYFRKLATKDPEHLALIIATVRGY